jgi:hypothetical protein
MAIIGQADGDGHRQAHRDSEVRQAQCQESAETGFVTLKEVRLNVGCKPVASEARPAQSNGTRHRLLGEDVTEPLVGEHYHNLSEEL